ncbi:replication protein [Candidatus Allofournierella merdipullorum]|uniref:replication protein n=1 Tax=Candidatus Allofournierella merdipullorum TaxID=2838595 RepID=UPI00374E34AC
MSIDKYNVSQGQQSVKRGRPFKGQKKDDKQQRKRNWLFVIYPGDSAPDNWRELLQGLCVEGCVSPLHDKDINEVDEEQKKAHRHVMLCYDGPVSYEQVKKISCDMLHGTAPIPCNSMRGSVRYFLHMDNPEKAQYSVSDMISLSGFDVEAALDVSGAMLREAVQQMQLFIIQEGITEFCDFADWCLVNNLEWHTVLCEKRTMFFERYIRSRRYKGSSVKDEGKG